MSDAESSRISRKQVSKLEKGHQNRIFNVFDESPIWMEENGTFPSNQFDLIKGSIEENQVKEGKDRIKYHTIRTDQSSQ